MPWLAKVVAMITKGFRKMTNLGCKLQTLNSLNESYVGCLWALAIAKVTDSESDTDSVWW